MPRSLLLPLLLLLLPVTPARAYYGGWVYPPSRPHAAPVQPRRAYPAYGRYPGFAPGYAPYPYAYRSPGRYRQARPAVASPQPLVAPKNDMAPGRKRARLRSSTPMKGSKGLVKHLKPELKKIDKDNNKQKFIDEILPYIEAENAAIAQSREWLQGVIRKLDAGRDLAQGEQDRLQALARRYRVAGEPLREPDARRELLRKVDIIPSSLALAQAAHESAWGQSRFAREANNLFGIWTYDPKKGLKPRRREEGKKHLVRVFSDVGESIRYYMHLLNSHPAYAELRAIRARLRRQKRPLDGQQLARGLEKYSARGERYITLIQRMIAQHDWASLDGAEHPA